MRIIYKDRTQTIDFIGYNLWPNNCNVKQYTKVMNNIKRNLLCVGSLER